MPPKEKSAKDKDDYQTGSSSKDSSEDLTRDKDDSQPKPNTLEVSSKKENRLDKSSPSEEVLRKSPVCVLTSDEICEWSEDDDPVVQKVKEFQEAKKSFGTILVFYLGNKRFTDDQRKSWIRILKKIRGELSLSNIPSEYETEASKEVEHLKFTKEEISQLCDRLGEDDYWDTTKSKEILVSESETSSDSEIEVQESEATTSRQAPKRSPNQKPRRPSWKKYKKGKNFASAYFNEQVEHFGFKKVIKKIVKRIWRKKKQQNWEKGDSSSIEVGKDEVQNLLFEAVGFMEKRYLGQIEAAATSIYRSDEKFESFCESGTYDSQDEWYPNKEPEESKISKMAVSVPTSTLQEYGLLDILITTLPMTLNYNDPDDTWGFIEVLKRARHRVPEHITLKKSQTVGKSERKEKHSGSTVIFAAGIEPTPNLERLERTRAKDYMKQIPTQDDEESETKSISTSVEHRLRFKSTESESLSPMQSDTAEASKDLKFIDESSAVESEETLQSEVSDHVKRGRSPVSPNTQLKKKSFEQ